MSSKCVVGTVLIVASLLLARTGLAEGSSPIHRGPWPIRDGFNHQPTEHELEALHLRDVTFFAVGARVPHIAAGIGGVATQALVNPYYGIDGVKMLRLIRRARSTVSMTNSYPAVKMLAINILHPDIDHAAPRTRPIPSRSSRIHPCSLR
jgi:Family of unknown function (DUF1028)